jgi:hypothetical protein
VTDLLFLVKPLINECGYDPQPRKALSEAGDTLWTGDEVQKEDALFRNPSRLENVDCHGGGTTFGTI